MQATVSRFDKCWRSECDRAATVQLEYKKSCGYWFVAGEYCAKCVKTAESRYIALGLPTKIVPLTDEEAPF